MPNSEQTHCHPPLEITPYYSQHSAIISIVKYQHIIVRELYVNSGQVLLNFYMCIILCLWAVSIAAGVFRGRGLCYRMVRGCILCKECLFVIVRDAPSAVTGSVSTLSFRQKHS